MTAPLLSIEDLTIRFGDADAVTDVSIEVGPGEIVALVGESGCGKSTIATAALRLLPRPARIMRGRIMFEGQDVLAMNAARLRALRGGGISMIFQEPMTSLNPVMTIGRQISEMLHQHTDLKGRAARDRTVALLDLVGLRDASTRVDDYPHRLSGGMRQRVMIALAIACGPKLLIADEPTTALDVTVQAQVMELLARLRRELSMSVLLISHDLGIVADWADRAVVMYAGRVCEAGVVTDLLAHPLHPYTSRLIAASPHMEPDLHHSMRPLTEIAGTVASARHATGCRFAPRCTRAQASCAEAVPPLIDIASRPARQLACPVVMPHGSGPADSGVRVHA